ncbi:MAG: hypothetical protein IIC67_11465 [Thaumarchaeota archaeon]|nr:hypothetical protein [Nitrososphaerota archaeon]
MPDKASIGTNPKHSNFLWAKCWGQEFFLVEIDYAGKDGVHEAEPNFTVKDLLEAANKILDLNK